MKIERDKWYVTRDGEKALVLCVDAPHKQPIIVMHADGEASNHGTDGRFYVDERDGTAGWDLVSEYVEPPKPREVWVFMDGSFFGSAYSSDEVAKMAIGTPSIIKKLVKFREVIE